MTIDQCQTLANECVEAPANDETDAPTMEANADEMISPASEQRDVNASMQRRAALEAQALDLSESNQSVTAGLPEADRSSGAAERCATDPAELSSGRQNKLAAAIGAHLSEEARSWLDKPVEQRLERIMRDIDIIHPILFGLINEVHWLIHEPRRRRARGLVVSGDPGSGKTVLATILQKTYPVEGALAKPHESAPPKVLVIQVSGVRTTKAILKRILEATKVPVSKSITTDDMESLVVDTLRRMNCALLVLDEMQDVLQARESEQLRVLEIIKYLMNALKLPILALGTDDAGVAFRADPHLQARFQVLKLSPWKPGDDFEAFLDAYETHLPLKHPSRLGSLAMQKALVKCTGGNLDALVTRLQNAAVHAVLSGTERITLDALRTMLPRPHIEALCPQWPSAA